MANGQAKYIGKDRFSPAHFVKVDKLSVPILSGELEEARRADEKPSFGRFWPHS